MPNTKIHIQLFPISPCIGSPQASLVDNAFSGKYESGCLADRAQMQDGLKNQYIKAFCLTGS